MTDLYFIGQWLPHYTSMGFIIWRDVSKHIANRITTLQKYAGRIILDIKNPREINSTQLFKKLNWLPFSDRITFLRAVLMFKCFNNAAPTYLSNKFHKVRDLHNIYTGQATADNLSLPKFKLAKAHLKERNLGILYPSLSSHLHHFPPSNVIF